MGRPAEATKRVTAQLVRHECGLWMRENSWDELIIRERIHYLGLDPRPEDVLLDLGANIGAVSSAFVDAGAGKVVALEPEPANFELLVRNLTPYGAQAVALKMAAALDTGVRNLWISESQNLGLHSLVRHRGRKCISVPSIALSSLLDLAQPTLVKIDIEGGEFELTPILSDLPRKVRGLAMEIHLGRREWRERAAQELIRALDAQGFREQGTLRITQTNRGTVGTWLR